MRGAASGSEASAREEGPAEAATGPPGARLRLLVSIVGVLAAVVLVGRAGSNLEYMHRALRVDGANTIGEAGKVYFAARFMNGESGFSSGTEPPYYPSVHGALTHWAVGAVGGVLGLGPAGLYGVGRTFSVLLTLAALVLLADLGRRLGIPRAALAVGAVAWIGTYALVQHTVSFRPDNWLLFLSASACWLLAARPSSRWSLLVLALIPTVAFHVKATGVVLVGAIAVVHVARRQWARAAVMAGVQVAILTASVVALEVGSDGAYGAGLRGTAHVPAGLEYVRAALRAEGDVMVLILLVAPVAVLARPRHLRVGAGRPVVTAVAAFWAVSGIGATLASARAGSASYYFLEPATYGLLLLLSWGVGRSARPWQTARPYVVLAVLTAACFPTAARWLRHGHPVDVAYFRSMVLGETRAALAASIDARGHYCYGDDPGLNALLRRPAIIYPVLQLQMIEAGALPESTLYDPLAEAAYDCVVLSGISRVYRGRPVVPPEAIQEAERAYPAWEPFGPYRILHKQVRASGG